jgi:hypothetical protein
MSEHSLAQWNLHQLSNFVEACFVEDRGAASFAVDGLLQ